MPTIQPAFLTDPDGPRDACAAGERLSTRERLAALAIDTGTSVSVEEVLRLGRRHLDMDVAFVGRVEAGLRHLRAVSASDASLEGLTAHTDPLAGSHCGFVLGGEIAALVPDALQDPVMVGVQATHDFQVRAFIGVPIVLPGGDVYGTLPSSTCSAVA